MARFIGGGGGEPNVPAWVEDENSPIVADNDPDLSGTISITPSFYKLFVKAESQSVAQSGDWRLQINGRTSGYDFQQEDGSEINASSAFDLARDANPRSGIVGTVTIRENLNHIRFYFDLAGPPGGRTKTTFATHGDIDKSGDITSISLSHTTTNIDGRLNIYGVDL